MIVAIPVGVQHVDKAAKLFNWCAKLDGGSRHPCLLVLAREIQYEKVQELLKMAGKAFCNISAVKSTFIDKMRQPDTDNFLFRVACAYSNAVSKQVFFWLGLDTFPSKPGWADQIESKNPNFKRPQNGSALEQYPLRASAFPDLFQDGNSIAEPDKAFAPYEIMRPEWPAIKKIARKWRRNPNVTLIYIHVPGDEKHWRYAREFVESYQKFPPEYPHKTIIVCQAKPAVALAQGLFRALEPTYFQHDDSGWDIGGYIAAMRAVIPSENTATDCIVCLGGSSYFQRAGWLKRIAEAWLKYGVGFYGATPTHEVSPHLCTSGFWTHPEILKAYPIKVVNRVTRYDFEHGPNACWKMAAHNGLPVKLITWDGEYDWPDWRKPPNIYRRGDQSNSLMCWHHYREYEKADDQLKATMANHSDTLTDPTYLNHTLSSPNADTFKSAHGFA